MKELALDMLLEEFKKISDKELCLQVIDILENMSFEQWFYISSSRSKHHNISDRGVGGNIRHTKSTLVVAEEMFPIYDFTEDQKNVIRASLILHDIAKPDPLHADIAYDYLMECNMREDICNAVRSHMGRWGKVFPYTQVEWFVHQCDYIASRKRLVIDHD
jgi:23S rRNA maturation-related 3'-5' exoribonuclease YhaM